MSTKNNPGRYDCLATAQEDEPYFVLLARDEDAEAARFHWIIARLGRIRDGRKPMADLAQVKEAIDALYAAMAWREAHRPHNPDGSLTPSRVVLPGPADRAWINNTLDILLGRLSGSGIDTVADRADDQGFRRGSGR